MNDKKKKIKRNSSTVLSSRKCPFCRAVNHPDRVKCRKCFLSLPQYPDLKDKGQDKTYSISFKDPRLPIFRIADYIETVAALIPAFLFLLEWLNRRKSRIPWQSLVPTLIAIVTLGLYFISTNQSVETICRNCGKTMVLSVPIRKQMFPQAVKCWACGAVYEIQWDFQKSKSLTYTIR